MTEDNAWVIRVGRPEDAEAYMWVRNLRGDLTPHRRDAMRMSYETAQGDDMPRHTFACILPWDGSWEQAFAKGAKDGYQQGKEHRGMGVSYERGTADELAYMAVAEVDYPEADHIKFFLHGYEFGYYLGTLGGTLKDDYLKVEKWKP